MKLFKKKFSLEFLVIFGRKQEKGSFKGSLMHELCDLDYRYQVPMEHSLELKCGAYGGEKRWCQREESNP